MSAPEALSAQEVAERDAAWRRVLLEQRRQLFGRLFTVSVEARAAYDRGYADGLRAAYETPRRREVVRDDYGRIQAIEDVQR